MDRGCCDLAQWWESGIPLGVRGTLLPGEPVSWTMEDQVAWRAHFWFSSSTPNDSNQKSQKLRTLRGSCSLPSKARSNPWWAALRSYHCRTGLPTLSRGLLEDYK